MDRQGEIVQGSSNVVMPVTVDHQRQRAGENHAPGHDAKRQYNGAGKVILHRRGEGVGQESEHQHTDGGKQQPDQRHADDDAGLGDTSNRSCERRA